MENISVNGVDITDLVLSFESYDELTEETIIGNAVSTQIKLKIKNKDNELEGLLGYPFLIGDKTYLAYEKPEKWTKVISLTLYDYMILANTNYNSELDYEKGVTISAQLDEMSSVLGIEVDKSTLSSAVLNKSVKWFDNTEIIRSYLGWIAECDGKNAYIEKNKIVFKPIAENTVVVDYCGDYELNEIMTISRVLLDVGVGEPISKGEDVGKTLYLNTVNSYLTQQDIDRIYDRYYGLSFYSFKNFECRDNGEIGLTDLVVYHDIIIIPLSIKRTVNGGQAKDTLVLSGDVKLQTVDTVIVENNIIRNVKRIKTTVDQNDAQLKIVAEQTQSNRKAISELQLTAEEFKVTAGTVEALEKKVALNYWIESSLGYSFEEESEDVSILTAHIYLGDNEYDVDGELSYNWYFVDLDGNETCFGSGKTIEAPVQILGGKYVYFTAGEEGGETFYFTDEKGNPLTDENGNVFTYQ